MTPSLLLTLAGSAAAAIALAAIGALALRNFSRAELDEICRRRNNSRRLGQILRNYERVALAAETLQVLATAVYVGVVAYWAHQALAGEVDTATLVSLGAGAALTLLAAEIWLPRAVAALWAEPLLYAAWPVLRVVGGALLPLVAAARVVEVLFRRVTGRIEQPADEASFEEEIRTVVSEGHREGLLEEEAREMIEGVIELSDVDVSQIMTPRTDMVSMPLALSWRDALDFVIRMGHSRIPVHDKTRDDIVGILYVKDLLPELAHGGEPSQPWAKFLREAYFVPETKPVDVLLQEFQRTRSHIAVVLDEYGGVSGLVTLEDVLEEIVGEIIDETDTDLVEGLKQIDEHTAEVLGRMHLDEINRRLEIDLPEDQDYDTIAGFVFSELGHVPVVGEQLRRQNVQITVIEATRRRIDRVRIEILDRAERETA